MNAVRKYLAAIGRKGGTAGRGKAKARTSEQARAAGKAGAAARWGKRENQHEQRAERA